jgi:hypothetical protein
MLDILEQFLIKIKIRCGVYKLIQSAARLAVASQETT